MIPDQTKREQAERRIQSAVNRSTFRANKPARKKQNADNKDFELLQVKIAISQLYLMYFPNLKIKRVAMYRTVCFTNSRLTLTPRDPRLKVKSAHFCVKQIKISSHITLYGTNNDKYMKNLSSKILTDHETALLAKGLKFNPTPRKPASHIFNFEAFTRSMRLQYIFANSKSKSHPFHVKSNWQPLPQPSVDLESYLERTKYEIASITFCFMIS